MSTLEFAGAVWRKSTRSGTGGGDNCVELALVDGTVGVRDSKNRDGSHLVFDGLAWRVLTDGLR